MLGTIQVERSVFQWIDSYIHDAAGAPVLALAAADFTVRFKKNNETTFTTKTLLTGIATTVASNTIVGAIALPVTDASVFPLSGSIRVGRGTPNDETVTFVGIPNFNTLTISAATNVHVATELVELVDFVEVGVGVYTFLFSDNELDTTGQFAIAITPNVGLQVVREVDIIYQEALGTVAPTALTICRLHGHVVDLAGSPLENVGVSARLLALPDIVSSTAVQRDTVAVRTDANGYFLFRAIQGATVDVAIPDVNYRRTILVPSNDSANLFDIASV